MFQFQIPTNVFGIHRVNESGAGCKCVVASQCIVPWTAPLAYFDPATTKISDLWVAPCGPSALSAHKRRFNTLATHEFTQPVSDNSGQFAINPSVGSNWFLFVYTRFFSLPRNIWSCLFLFYNILLANIPLVNNVLTRTQIECAQVVNGPVRSGPVNLTGQCLFAIDKIVAKLKGVSHCFVWLLLVVCVTV